MTNNNNSRRETSRSLNPFPLLHPVSISWHNIQVRSQVSASVVDTVFCRKNRGQQSVEIIRNVSGAVKSGQLLAIMGASGAGKTTLLNVLTARNLSKVIVDGEVKLNGRYADTNTMSSVSAYVQQMDLFIPVLTVREHLIFNSLLRMDPQLTAKERTERVNQLLIDFSLKRCADSRIGSNTTFKGISGGEAKRLSFASEIMTNPSIMFCDEPTSGLDSFMSENIVQVMKDMASNGRTVIFTIHQPSSQVVKLFEQLLLIADGRVAFMGNIDEANNFFSSIGYTCPTNFNPCDYYIQQLAKIPGKEIECKTKTDEICDKFLDYSSGTNLKPKSVTTTSSGGNNSFKLLKKKKSLPKQILEAPTYRTNCFRQFRAVMWRSSLIVLREPMITHMQLLQTVIVSIVIGVVYFNQQLDPKGVMNINGALFLLLTNLTFQNAMAVINTFCVEQPLFFRDHHNGMYRVDVYFVSKTIAELPVFILIPTLFVSIYYYMVGFNPRFEHFIIMIIISNLSTQCAVSFGYLISCMTSSASMALSMGPPQLIPIILFGGFLLNNASIPKLLVWIKYISWFYYSFESLVINQWSDIRHIDCDLPIPQTNNQTTIIGNNNIDNNQTIPSPSAPLPSRLCFSIGKDVIDYYNFNENHLIRNLFVLYPNNDNDLN
ncbi:protein white-like [Oppia nitens]|uniref:protein white-like n=1 Tax=Oppia nitens TaxID=1686743 RepID=UPI0023DBCE42|nr:protein white-like [Oppia nitens]